MAEALEAGNFFNPIVKKVWPNCVNKPMQMIQTNSSQFGVTQLINTTGNKVINETSGKYWIIT